MNLNHLQEATFMGFTKDKPLPVILVAVFAWSHPAAPVMSTDMVFYYSEGAEITLSTTKQKTTVSPIESTQTWLLVSPSSRTSFWW